MEGTPIRDPQQALLSVLALNLALVALTVGAYWGGVLVARSFGIKAGYSLVPLGFSRPQGGFLAGAGIGVAVGVGGVILSMIVNPLSVLVLDRLGYQAETTVQQPFMRGLESWVSESPQLAIPAIIFVVVVLGPLVEELVFRGAIFNGLYKLSTLISTRRNPSTRNTRIVVGVPFVLSALASSAFFAVLHLEPIILPALLALAVALCYLFARTGSLVPSFAAHATFNSFATSLIILSGLGVFEMPG